MTTVLFFMLTVFHQAGPSGDLAVLKSQDVTGCSLIAEYYWSRSAPDRSREIWLRSTGSPARHIRLTTYERDADVVFSPDCEMIALNDNVGSNIGEVRLFRRISRAIDYEPVPTADPTRKAWESFATTYHIPRLNEFLLHTYVNAVAWSSDSRALLLRVWGQSGSLNRVDDWYCVFDLRANNVSTDLAAMNRGSVVVNGHPRQ